MLIIIRKPFIAPVYPQKKKSNEVLFALELDKNIAKLQQQIQSLQLQIGILLQDMQGKVLPPPPAPKINTHAYVYVPPKFPKYKAKVKCTYLSAMNDSVNPNLWTTCMSSQGKLAVVKQNMIHVFDCTSQTLVTKPYAWKGGIINSIFFFGPKEKHILIVSNNGPIFQVQLLDIMQGKCEAPANSTLKAHGTLFAANGRELLTCSSQGCVKYTLDSDTASIMEYKAYAGLGHVSSQYAMAFSDKHVFISSNDYNSMLMLSFATNYWINCMLGCVGIPFAPTNPFRVQCIDRDKMVVLAKSIKSGDDSTCVYMYNLSQYFVFPIELSDELPPMERIVTAFDAGSLVMKCFCITTTNKAVIVDIDLSQLHAEGTKKRLFETKQFGDIRIVTIK